MLFTRLKKKPIALGFTVIFVVGCVLRLLNLNQPIRFDEANTYMRFIEPGLWHLTHNYDAPNNHVGHSLIAFFSTYFFPYQEWALRIPVLLFGLLNIVLIYVVGTLYHNKTAGLYAALLTALSPYLILYSTNARGYTLLISAALISLICIWKFNKKQAPKRYMLLYLIAQIYGMYTVPTMLYASMGFAIFLFYQAMMDFILHKKAQPLILFFGSHLIISIGVILLYLPIINTQGIDILINNHHVSKVPWDAFTHSVSPRLRELYQTWNQDFHPFLFHFLLLLALLPLIRNTKGRKTYQLLSVSIILSLIGLTLYKQIMPLTRALIYIYPIFILYASIGFTHLVEILNPYLKKPILHTGLVLLIISAGIHAQQINPIPESLESGTSINARDAVLKIKSFNHPNHHILCSFFSYPCLKYYYHKYDVCAHFDPNDNPIYALIQTRHGEDLENILEFNGVFLKSTPPPQAIATFSHAKLYSFKRKELGESPVSLFPKAKNTDAYYYAQSSWFGQFNYYYFPWIKHETHGWLQCLNHDPNHLKIYDKSLNEILWISPDTYPLLQLGKYPGIMVEYDRNTQTPNREFRVVETGEIIKESEYNRQSEDDSSIRPASEEPKP